MVELFPVSIATGDRVNFWLMGLEAGIEVRYNGRKRSQFPEVETGLTKFKYTTATRLHDLPEDCSPSPVSV